MNMDRSQVMAALEAVNAVLKAKGQKATVVITGGAAIMFQFPDFPREVKDLDGGYMSPELQVAVEQVTWEMDLADGWFNDTSKDYYAPKKGQTVPGPQFSNLSIQLPSKEYLLCLKIMSGRPEEKANDPVDVGFMVMHMPEIKSEKDWQDMYVKFFGKNDWKPYTAEAARRAIEAKGGKTSGLKTEKGTPIKRSRLGVGKDIGGAIYLHRDYKNYLPNQAGLLKAEKVALANGMQDYNVIKAGKDGTYTFIKSPDFDTADEPTVGTYLTVKPDGSFKNGYSNAIWHHKWLWVMDDYAGFDVAESKERSRKWLSLPGVDFNRIGNKEYWNTNVVPKISSQIEVTAERKDLPEGTELKLSKGMMGGGRGRLDLDLHLPGEKYPFANGQIETSNLPDFWNFHSHAPKGYGPALYDIAMAYATSNGAWLISSAAIGGGRRTSEAAENVWKYYYFNRSDVKKSKPIEIDPRDAEFRGKQHMKKEKPWLFCGYKLNKPVESMVTSIEKAAAKTAKTPYKLQEFEGFQILIGRSAIENDILSLEVANPNDFWFHVAGAPGSHIVVRNPDNLKELPGPVAQQVKQLAVHNSKARGTSAEVHWGFAKDVSKSKGAADGEVNLANWKKI